MIILFIYLYIASIRYDSIYCKFHIQASFEGRENQHQTRLAFKWLTTSFHLTQNDLMILFKCAFLFMLLLSTGHNAMIDLIRLHCSANCLHCVAIFAIHSIDCIRLSFIHSAYRLLLSVRKFLILVHIVERCTFCELYSLLWMIIIVNDSWKRIKLFHFALFQLLFRLMCL